MELAKKHKVKNKRSYESITPFSVGRQESRECEEKVVINYQFFLSNYDKIMAMKEQVQFIRYILVSQDL